MKLALKTALWWPSVLFINAPCILPAKVRALSQLKLTHWRQALCTYSFQAVAYEFFDILVYHFGSPFLQFVSAIGVNPPLTHVFRLYLLNLLLVSFLFLAFCGPVRGFWFSSSCLPSSILALVLLLSLVYSLLVAWWCLCHAFKNVSFYVGTFCVGPTLPHYFPTCLLRFASVVGRSEEFWFSSIVFPWAGLGWRILALVTFVSSYAALMSLALNILALVHLFAKSCLFPVCSGGAGMEALIHCVPKSLWLSFCSRCRSFAYCCLSIYIYILLSLLRMTWVVYVCAFCLGSTLV